MAAGPIGERILVTNHSENDMTHLVMIINEDDGGHTLKISRIMNGASLHFGARVFRDADGARFDPKRTRIKTFTVIATVPAGRGRWRTTYPNWDKQKSESANREQQAEPLRPPR